MTPISTPLITPIAGNVAQREHHQRDVGARRCALLWIIQLLSDVSRLRWLSIAPFGIPVVPLV